MSRVPIRITVTLAFAVVMAVLLAALGLFVYDRVESQLNDTIDQGLQGRVNEARTIVEQSDPDELREGRLLAESEESFGQILTPEEALKREARIGSKPMDTWSPTCGARSLGSRMAMSCLPSFAQISVSEPIGSTTSTATLRE